MAKNLRDLDQNQKYCSKNQKEKLSNTMGPNDTLLSNRPVPCSAIIRTASFCSSWEQIQRPTARNYAESQKALEYSALNGMLPSNPSHHSSGKLVEEEAGRDSIEAREMEDTKKTRPLNQHDQRSYDPTDTEPACPGPASNPFCIY